MYKITSKNPSHKACKIQNGIVSFSNEVVSYFCKLEVDHPLNQTFTTTFLTDIDSLNRLDRFKHENGYLFSITTDDADEAHILNFKGTTIKIAKRTLEFNQHIKDLPDAEYHDFNSFSLVGAFVRVSAASKFKKAPTTYYLLANSVVAINEASIIEAWHGMALPFEFEIPQYVILEILKKSSKFDNLTSLAFVQKTDDEKGGLIMKFLSGDRIFIHGVCESYPPYQSKLVPSDQASVTVGLFTKELLGILKHAAGQSAAPFGTFSENLLTTDEGTFIIPNSHIKGMFDLSYLIALQPALTKMGYDPDSGFIFGTSSNSRAVLAPALQ